MRRIARVGAMGTALVCLTPTWLTGGLADELAAAQTRPSLQATTESSNDLSVSAGKSIIVNSVVPVERISVGYGDFAEATAVSPYEVLVNGKAPGATSLIIWQKGGGKLMFDLTVRPSRFSADSRLESVRRAMSSELAGQAITLTIENETVYLRGKVKDLTSADRAVAIASTAGKVVNLLYVDVPQAESQILLKVKFASVDRNNSLQLGLNLFSTGATNTIGSTGTQQFSPPTLSGLSNNRQAITTTLSNALNIFLFRPDLNLGATIEALQLKNLLQVLAEPNVLAQNGKQASFLAGGEFPFPVVQAGAGSSPVVTIQFREFGVRLNFIPTITPRGTIQLQVAQEVSALDFTNGLSVSGFNVPALTVRRVNTEVELNEKQSFAIAGLLDNRDTETFEKIPFVGDIPVIGKFFQSKLRNKNNTELLVIVTPELVHPIPAGQPVPMLEFPKPFMAPNTGKDLRTPGVDVTGPVTSNSPSKSIPVESLIQSQQPERTLVLGNGPIPVGTGPQQTFAPAAPTTPPAVPPK